MLDELETLESQYLSEVPYFFNLLDDRNQYQLVSFEYYLQPFHLPIKEMEPGPQ